MNDNKIISIEIIHKELDLIQSCITRMDNNSFILKGWLISLFGCYVDGFAWKNEFNSAN